MQVWGLQQHPLMGKRMVHHFPLLQEFLFVGVNARIHKFLLLFLLPLTLRKLLLLLLVVMVVVMLMVVLECVLVML